jgi:L,D-transpeptidase catalytic domain
MDTQAGSDRRGTVPSTTGWHIVVDTARRRATVYDYGRAVRTFAAIVGKPSTPTPRGEFFVEEDIQLQPGRRRRSVRARVERPLQYLAGV